MNRNAADWPKEACITLFGSGYASFAPGSWGSLFAIIVYAAVWLTCAALQAPLAVLTAATLVGVAGASIIAVVWGEWAIQRWNSKDPKPFVLDEFAGQWMSMVLLPLPMTIGAASDWLSIAMLFGGQFFVFRFFDVLKPPPARQLERLPAGWGVLCDDLMSGVYANLVGQLIWRLLVPAGG